MSNPRIVHVFVTVRVDRRNPPDDHEIALDRAYQEQLQRLLDALAQSASLALTEQLT